MRVAGPVAEDFEQSVPPVADGDADPGDGRFEVLGEGHFELLPLLDSSRRDPDLEGPVPRNGLEFVPLGEGRRRHDLHHGDARCRWKGLRRIRSDEILLQMGRMSIIFFVRYRRVGS
jgi:hypothetical protein